MGEDAEGRGRHVDRDRLLRDLRWLAEGNPQYAGTDEEGRQDRSIAQLMADDLLLSYIGDGEITRLFNEIRGGYSR
jgi:hypothetical protein